MAIVIASLEILSNDGATSLTTYSNSPMNLTVTETGLSDGAYTYSGDKTFIGFATSANATEPTYAVGDTFSLDRDMSLYIVEASASTPTLTYDLTQLNLSAGTHSITVRAKADGYADSEPSNAVEYVVKESVPTDLTGYTVTVPAGWSAKAGYGIFYPNIEVKFGTQIVGANVLRIGYDGMGIATADVIYVGYSITPSSSFSMTFMDNRYADDASLIQWCVDNNATFKKTA